MKGLLLVDKPGGMTSHDVVDDVRRAAGQRRVGHTGALDPAATGLLVLCLGRATRLAEFVQGMDKTYEGRIRLGVVTDTDDLDGTVLEERPVGDCGAGRIEAAISEFRGEIEQTPPAVSAVKVGGERLYKKARRGENVVAPPRRVTIHDLEVTGLEPPDVLFRLRCSRGTYARSIARDLGEKLGCGGALASLRRTQVGVHRVEDAAPLAKLKGPQDVAQALRPLENALTLPVAIISGEFRNRVLSGNALAPEGLLAAPAGEAGDWVQIKLESGELLAVGQIVGGEEGRLVQPKRVLAA